MGSTIYRIEWTITRCLFMMMTRQMLRYFVLLLTLSLFGLVRWSSHHHGCTLCFASSTYLQQSGGESKFSRLSDMMVNCDDNLIVNGTPLQKITSYSRQHYFRGHHRYQRDDDRTLEHDCTSNHCLLVSLSHIPSTNIYPRGGSS